MRKAPGATTPALADKPSWHSIVEPSQPPWGVKGSWVSNPAVPTV